MDVKLFIMAYSSLTCSHTLQISSPWKPPATIKFSLMAIVLICTLESDWGKNPGRFCKNISNLSRLVLNANFSSKKTRKIENERLYFILVNQVTTYQSWLNWFCYIEYFFAPPEHRGPMHYWIVLHKVYIILRCSPQQIPQLHKKKKPKSIATSVLHLIIQENKLNWN